MKQRSSLTHNNIAWYYMLIWLEKQLGVLWQKKYEEQYTWEFFHTQSLAGRTSMVLDCSSCTLCGGPDRAWTGGLGWFEMSLDERT